MRLDEENMRSRKFLHSSSYAKVTKECQERMVADHIGLLHSDCHDFVEKERRKGSSLVLRVSLIFCAAILKSTVTVPVV